MQRSEKYVFQEMGTNTRLNWSGVFFLESVESHCGTMKQMARNIAAFPVCARAQQIYRDVQCMVKVFDIVILWLCALITTLIINIWPFIWGN